MRMTRPQGHQSALRYTEQLATSDATLACCVALTAACFVTLSFINLLCQHEKALGQGMSLCQQRLPPRLIARLAPVPQSLLETGIAACGKLSLEDHFGAQGTTFRLPLVECTRRRPGFQSATPRIQWLIADGV
jgi:hypothetical protein